MDFANFQKINILTSRIETSLHLDVPDIKISLHSGIPNKQISLYLVVPNNQVSLHFDVPNALNSKSYYQTWRSRGSSTNTFFTHKFIK